MTAHSGIDIRDGMRDAIRIVIHRLGSHEMSGTITTDHAAEFCNEYHQTGSRLLNPTLEMPHCRECGDALQRCTCDAWVHNLGEHEHDPDGDWYTVSGAADYDAAIRRGLGIDE